MIVSLGGNPHHDGDLDPVVELEPGQDALHRPVDT
jgi:hypothetical protein